jgi:peptide/nickel transport system permease protein
MSVPDLHARGPLPDTFVDPVASGAVEDRPPTPGRRGGRGRSGAIGVAALVAGFALIVAGTTLLADAGMGLRVLLVVVGIGVTYQGVSHVGRGLFGPKLDTAFWLSVGWLGLVLGLALLAPLLPLGEEKDTSKTLLKLPFERPDLFGENPLGTNNFGLDELARVIYGARASLTVAVVAVLVGIVVGGAIGVFAGYQRGYTDGTIGIFNNTLLAFPPLVLLLAISAVLDPSVRTLTIGLSILSIPINVRLARATTMQIAQREFVQAARAMGATRRRVIVRELVPNVLPTLISYGMIVVAVMIVAEASLSFLGLGIKQPEPSWGNMIAEGQQGVFEANPHIVLVPGVALFLTVFSFNLIGEKLHARWDPRRRAL